MSPLIAAEILKLRTTRSLWVAAAVVVVAAVAIPVVVVVSPSGVEIPKVTPATLAELVRAPANLTGAAVLLVGLLASAGEFRHHTVLTTRLVEPRQGRVLAAKLVAIAIVGGVLGVLAEVLAGAAGAVALAFHDVPVEPLSHDVPRIVGVVPLVVIMYGLAGVAVGALFRSTAGAVGATFAWAFVVEGILPLVTRSPGLAHWLPGGTADQVLATQTAPGQLSAVAAGGLLLGYVAVLLAAATVLDTRREL